MSEGRASSSTRGPQSGQTEGWRRGVPVPGQEGRSLAKQKAWIKEREAHEGMRDKGADH